MKHARPVREAGNVEPVLALGNRKKKSPPRRPTKRQPLQKRRRGAGQ